MIERRTVLVLGAGSSMPYGFPSGRELIKDVGDLLSNYRTNLVRHFGSLDVSMVKSFQHDLHFSGRESVDAFLEGRRQFVDLGKVVIATALLRRELQTAGGMFDVDPAENWYRYLLNRMTDGATPDVFDENRLGLVTFNYDRSLEHYLFTALKATYGLADDAAARLVDAVPIVHVHGSLGPLNWQAGGKYPYGYELLPELPGIAAKGIKILQEEKEGGFAEAGELVSVPEDSPAGRELEVGLGRAGIDTGMAGI